MLRPSMNMDNYDKRSLTVRRTDNMRGQGGQGQDRDRTGRFQNASTSRMRVLSETYFSGELRSHSNLRFAECELNMCITWVG